MAVLIFATTFCLKHFSSELIEISQMYVDFRVKYPVSDFNET